MKFVKNWGRLGMKFETVTFEEITINYDKKRVPLSTKQRESIKGDYRYYGAQGVIDYIDDYIFDGKYLLIAEDGENLKSKKQNIAQLAEGKFWVNNHAHIVQCNSKCRIEYLCYLINSMDLSGYITGSAQPKLSQANINKISFRIPTIEQQDLILSVLIPIEKKINLNNQINENLEQQAQALFKAWFVDFEPFGGAMPDDWTETTLGTIAAISTKSINPLKQPDLYLEHYSIPAYDEQHYPVFEYANEIKSNKYVLTKNSVMISKLNPATKRIWRPLCLSDNPVCSTEFIVYEAIDPKHKDYIYSLIDSQSFSDYLCARTTGSTNSRQRATPKTTLDFPCVLPTNDTISQFCGVVTPIYNQIGANLIENQRLASLRDTLLPKLMNGEIDVSEVKI